MNPDFNLFNPYIRAAMNSVLKSGREIKRRIILDYELIYVEDGNFILEYADCEYSCKKGDVLLIHPGIPHSFKDIDTDLSQPHIHFDAVFDGKSRFRFISFKDRAEFTSAEKQLIIDDIIITAVKSHPFLVFKDKTAFLKLFYSVIDSGNKNSLECKANMLCILSHIISDNCRFDSAPYPETENTVAEQIKAYIDAGQGIATSLDEYEKQFSYSKYYIEKQFKKKYGISVIAYRNKKRMEQAPELLKKESVSAVADMLGFGSIYSFSRAFKLYYGIAPTGYRATVS